MMIDPYNTGNTTEIEVIEWDAPDMSETQRIRSEIVRRLREDDEESKTR